MPATQTIPNSRVMPVFLLGVAARVAQGFAAFAPIAVCFRSDVNWGFLSPGTIAAGAVASGMGLGAGLDRKIRGVFGTAIVVRSALLVLAAGLWMLWLRTEAEFTISIGFALGLVVGTEWSSLADVTRRSLPNSQRWQGVRCWTVAFFVGVALAISMHSIISITILIVALVASICFAAALSINLATTDEPETERPPTEITPPPADSIEAAPSLESADECDATECCGGSKPWRQTSFAHGAMLSSVGWFALFGGLRLLAEQSWPTETSGPATWLAGGVILGSLLIFSVAPSTGYSVALLPFFLLAIPLTVVRHIIQPTGFWNAATLFACGTAFAAIHCGIKLVIGELFTDCSTDPLRTRVVCVSLFAASIIVPCSVAMEHLLPSGMWQAIPSLIVMICGIASLRSLPSPVVSSLGEDNPEEPDLEELKDVMATINN